MQKTVDVMYLEYATVSRSLFVGVWFQRGKQSRGWGRSANCLNCLSDRGPYSGRRCLCDSAFDHGDGRRGLDPDDVEGAFEEQAAIEERLNQERARFGRAIFPDRRDGRLRRNWQTLRYLGRRAEPGYLKWLLSRPDLTEETKGVLLKATGQTEQGSSPNGIRSLESHGYYTRSRT